MNLTFSLSGRTIVIYGAGKTRVVSAWSEVRNELNGLRPKEDIPDICYSYLADTKEWSKYTPHKGPPVMPRQFPVGTWNVTGIVAHPDPNDSYLYPYFIATDATDILDEWELDEHGFYLRPTGRKVRIGSLGLHYSQSITTVGCIRYACKADLIQTVEDVRAALARKEKIPLEVTV